MKMLALNEELNVMTKPIGRKAGIMRMISGREVNLKKLQPEDITIDDIAWGLGRTLRYGGHIREDYTVAHHSIIMSYCVNERYQLEALLHDAAEAYMGDMIWPVKAMFKSVDNFENEIALKIMDRFNVSVDMIAPVYNKKITTKYRYLKSVEVARTDIELQQHECVSMGRPGKWYDNIEKAWLHAVDQHQEWWWAPQYAFLQRFDQLTGTNHFQENGDPSVALQATWFPEPELDTADVEVDKMMQSMGVH